MTITDPEVERRSQLLDVRRAMLAAAPPLPSAEELAAPFIRGVQQLAEAFEGRAEGMEYDLEIDAGYQAEARELVDTANRVASLVRGVILGNLSGVNRSLTFDTDNVIRALCNTGYVESLLNRPTVDPIIFST
jgi:hypothetical protein